MRRGHEKTPPTFRSAGSRLLGDAPHTEEVDGTDNKGDEEVIENVGHVTLQCVGLAPCQPLLNLLALVLMCPPSRYGNLAVGTGYEAAVLAALAAPACGAGVSLDHDKVSLTSVSQRHRDVRREVSGQLIPWAKAQIPADVVVIAIAPVGSTQGFDKEHCHSPVCGAGTMPAPVELT